MFLKAVQERNPGLIRFAAELHQRGAIPPNTYVIDLDAVRRNAQRLALRAQELGLSLYYMAKQFGYNPHLIEAIRQYIPGSVAVDWMGAEALLAQGAKVSHVGHLVPVPFHLISMLMSQARPEVWTLLDLEAAEAVSRTALSQGIRQPVLLRIIGDQLYPGQEGGFLPEGVVDVAHTIAGLRGLQLVGATCYPCFAWDEQQERYRQTGNLTAVLNGVRALQEAGYMMTHINMPGNTSYNLLPQLAHYGATHGEPGHALTGTTPEQSVGRSEEEPAVVYVSEVSAVQPSGKAQVYGGGLYARGHARSALVGSTVEAVMRRPPLPVFFPPAEYIDYQCTLDTAGERVHTGDTVIMAFRFQLFVLRSYLAIVQQGTTGRELLSLSPRSLLTPPGSGDWQEAGG